MSNYDYEYYKTGAGKQALSLPTWENILTNLNQTQRDAIKTDLAAHDQTWPPTGTPSKENGGV